MKNKTIAKVVKKAKEYVKQGYNYTESIAKAQQDVEMESRNKYESKI